MNDANQKSGLEAWVRDIDSKVDKLLESVTRIEVHSGRDSERLDGHSERITANEAALKELEKEHQFVKGQMRMLMIIGSMLVGLAVVAEVILLVLK